MFKKTLTNMGTGDALGSLSAESSSTGDTRLRAHGQTGHCRRRRAPENASRAANLLASNDRIRDQRKVGLELLASAVRNSVLEPQAGATTKEGKFPFLRARLGLSDQGRSGAHTRR